MKNRRIFLKSAGAFALGSLFLPGCNTKQKNVSEETTTPSDTTQTAAKTEGNLGPIGIQIYSVKDLLEKDLQGTLRQLADIGYKEIESYPGQKGHYYGMEPKDFRSLLEGMGLNLVSSHFGSGSKNSSVDSWQKATIQSKLEEFVEKAATTGQKYLTCSSLDGSLRKTKDDLKKTAEIFNKTGEICKKAGLQFAYHNHAFEFEKVGDVILYDFLLENTDPELVKYEMDLFWVVNGGQDPIAYLNKYPGRFPLFHIKDMNKEDKNKNTEIGQGSINFAEILKVATQKGENHFFVEQENFDMPVMESMKINYQNLSKISV